MQNNTMTLVFSIIYFALILFIGWLAGKKTKNMADFMVGGRGMGVWVIALGIMAAIMSGGTWLGGPGASYANGWSAVTRFIALSPLGTVIAYWFLARPMRIISGRANCYTLPDILAARWNNNKFIRALSCCIILVGSLVFLVSQWTSMGTVLQPILGLDYSVCVIIGAIIITAYVVTGGMLASMWTNLIQMIIMFVLALIATYKSIDLAGGMTVMNQSLAQINPEFVTPLGPYGFIDVFSYGVLSLVLAYGGQPGINTKFMMVRDSKQLRWVPALSILALWVGCMVYYIGCAGIVLVDQGVVAAPERSDQILMNVVSTLFSPTIGSLVVVAIMAAVMSTAETHLFNSAAAVTQDLMCEVFGMKLNEKKKLLYTRVALGVVTVGTIILALNPVEFISLLNSVAVGAFCAGFGPILYLGLRWKRVNSKAAIAGMIAGLMGGVIPIIDPNNVVLGDWIPAGVMTVVSFAVIIIVSLVTKPDEMENRIFNPNYKPEKIKVE